MNGRRCSLAEAFELLAPDFEPKAAAAKIERVIHNDDRFPLYCNGKVVEADIAATVMVVPKSKDRPADIVSTGPWLGWAPGAYNWELEIDAVLALKPQPDTRVEAAQATAISALQKAETATAETASVRAELEKALAEARAEAQATRERADAAEKRAEALEARVEAMKLSSSNTPLHRKPGRKFTDDWPMQVAKEMFRLARLDDEILENINGLTEHTRNFLEGEIGWRGPNDDKEIHAQIRFLRGQR